MSDILLTQNTGIILGPVAKLLGYIMEGIFFVIDKNRHSKYWTCYYIIHDRYLSVADASYHQTAEVFKITGKNESGITGDSEKV